MRKIIIALCPALSKLILNFTNIQFNLENKNRILKKSFSQNCYLKVSAIELIVFCLKNVYFQSGTSNIFYVIYQLFGNQLLGVFFPLYLRELLVVVKLKMERMTKIFYLKY